jgi:thioesterase domain-containing protein
MGIIYEDSLSIVQVVQGGQKSSIPLVLIHDGGGTIQSYQALGPIGRDVFAIANPRFDDGVPWDGGIPEMARTYAQIIKARVPSKTVLLGGTLLRC